MTHFVGDILFPKTTTIKIVESYLDKLNIYKPSQNMSRVKNYTMQLLLSSDIEIKN